MIEIGNTIRRLRNWHKFSIQDLAEKTALSVSHLSKIERGLVSPSLVALEKIANAFQVPVTTLFSTRTEENPVTRKEDRAQILLPSRIVESLNNNSSNQSFGVYFCTEGEGINGDKKGHAAKDKLSFFSHDGEELIHVLEGEMSFHLGLEEHILRTGDSIFFDANIPHSAKRLTPQIKLLIVTSPSTPFSRISSVIRG